MIGMNLLNAFMALIEWIECNNESRKYHTSKCAVRGFRCIVMSRASLRDATTLRNIDLNKENYNDINN